MKYTNGSPQSHKTALQARHDDLGFEKQEHSVSKSLEVQSVQSKAIASSKHAVVQFNDLPGCAFVRQPTVLALFACSKASLWRWVKSGRLPAPKRLGLRISAWNVGQLRACLNNLQTSGQADSTEGGK